MVDIVPQRIIGSGFLRVQDPSQQGPRSSDPYEFHIGLHYTLEAPVQRVLGPLGVEVEFREFDPGGMFRLFGPDREFAVPAGMGAFRSRLCEAFPAERHTIDAFLGTVELLSGELDQILEQLLDTPHLRELPQLPWRLRGLLRYGTSTAGGYLDTLHASLPLKTALLEWTTIIVMNIKACHAMLDI